MRVSEYCSFVAAPRLSAAGSSLIDQNLTHGPSRHGQEVLSGVERHVTQVDHPQESFIGQVIGLQGDLTFS